MDVSDRDIEKFYKTLELPLNSSQAEVKAAYRSLARKYHPDRFTGDPDKLKASEDHLKIINAAYAFLKTYDPSTQKGKNTTSKFNVEVQTARNPADRTPAAFVRQAQLFQEMGNLQEALMALDTAIALEDDYYPAYDLRSEVRFALGNTYGSGMDLKRAKHYRWVYQSEGRSIDSPTKSKSSSTSGTAARGVRDSVHIKFPSYPTDFSPKVHRKGTQPDQSPSGYFHEARRLQALGDLEEAVMLLDKAISLKDDYYLAYELRGEIYLALGNDSGYRLDLRRGKHFRWKQTGKHRSSAVSDSSKEKYTSPAPQKPPAAKVTVETKPPQSKPLQKQPELHQVFSGHVDTISQILFVNRSLISASHDGTVRIWCVETGIQQGYLAVGAAVTAIAASPDSNLFITGDRSGKIKMWNLVDRKLIRSIPLHTGKITGIHFTQNGKGFVTTGEDGILKIFQLNPASLRHTLQISKVPIFCSGLMGNRIFTASANSQLNVIEQGQIIHAESLASPMSQTMAVSTDRKWIAIGDDRGSIHCFDAQGNLHKSFVGCSGRIQSVNFLSSGKKLLVVGETPLIKIWDTTTWNLWTEWKVLGTGQLTTAQVQGNQIAIAQGNSLQLWQLP